MSRPDPDKPAGPGDGRAAMTPDQGALTASRRSRIRLIVQGVLSLVLVAAIFYYLLKKLDPAQVWAAITDMTWTELATLSLLAIWNLCTYALVWMTVTPGLGFWRAMVMTQATTAVANTVPGGSAIGIAMTYSQELPAGLGTPGGVNRPARRPVQSRRHSAPSSAPCTVATTAA